MKIEIVRATSGAAGLTYTFGSHPGKLRVWLDRANLNAFFDVLTENLVRGSELCAEYLLTGDLARVERVRSAVDAISKCPCLKIVEVTKALPVYRTDPSCGVVKISVPKRPHLEAGLSSLERPLTLTKILTALRRSLDGLDVSTEPDRRWHIVRNRFLVLADLAWSLVKDLVDAAELYEEVGNCRRLGTQSAAVSDVYYLAVLFPHVK